MSKVKSLRNKELVRMKKKNPKMTFQELGDHFNIRRTTAFKIYKKSQVRYL